jgi:uracil-DNA glycosylase family 4
MKNLSDLNWLYQMGLESTNIASDIPFDFTKNLETSNTVSVQNKISIKPTFIKKIEENRLPNLIIPSQDAKKIAASCNNLEELRQAVMSFTGCDLKKTAINTVFADGNPDADIMLIGEAPGANEDAKGIPFCGESGMLLDNIFRSIDLSRRENLYITNSVFWRPPANRRPTNEEIEICKAFLERHIALVKPKLIVLVGSTAVAAILGHHFKISDVRGKFLTYQNSYLPEKIDLTAIFHPAYLLRQPSQKKDTWYDMLRIKNYLSSL